MNKDISLQKMSLALYICWGVIFPPVGLALSPQLPKPWGHTITRKLVVALHAAQRLAVVAP